MRLADPDLVPGGDLDPETMEDAARTLRGDASAIRERAAGVAGAWQGLSACYEAPETDQVLRAMDPVTAGADRIAENLETVARALDWFATDVRAIQDKRRQLVLDIQALRSRAAEAALGAPSAVGGGGRSDGALGGSVGGLSGLVPLELAIENTALLNRSTALGNELEDAERDCARKIQAAGSPATLADAFGDWFTDVHVDIAGTFSDMADGWDDFTDNVEGAWETATDAVADGWDDTVDWTTARVEDVSDWIGDRAETIEGAWQTFGEAIDALEQANQGTADDPRPQVTALGASYLQYLGAGIDALLTTALGGTVDFKWADDGDPWAGEPIKYDPENPRDGQAPPTELKSLEDLFASVTDSYDTNSGMGQVADNDLSEGYVRFTKVIPPGGGDPVLVVSIPGTQPWFSWDDLGNDHPADWIGNLIRAGGGRTTYSESVVLALERMFEVDPSLRDAPIMMVGHSQGGMTAADLASDQTFVDDYNLTDILTFGAPIANDRIQDGVRTFGVAHESDIVPGLDLGDLRIDPHVTTIDGHEAGPLARPKLNLFGESTYLPNPEEHTEVYLPDPKVADDLPIWEKPVAWHSHVEYANSVRAETEPGSVLGDYEASIAGGAGDGGFLVDGATFEVFDVPVQRIN